MVRDYLGSRHRVRGKEGQLGDQMQHEVETTTQGLGLRN